MNKTVLDFINTIYAGTHVVIHLPSGSTEWNVDTPEVNRLLAGRVGRHYIERTMITYTPDGNKTCHIYPKFTDTYRKFF